MQSSIVSRNTQSGCTNEATNNNLKTAKISNITAATEATRSCCSSSNSSNSSANSSSNSCRQSRKISSQRPLTLLLITMTLAIFATTHLPGSAHAAAISAEASAQAQTLLDDVSVDASLELTKHAAAAQQQQHNANRARRTRLRKRHTNHFYFHQHPHESDTELEWQNPCGGTFVGGAQSAEGDVLFQRQTMKQHLKDLRNAVKHQFTNAEFYNEIQIDDMDTWQAHRNLYKFLPRLKPNSSITLKRWYRNMQTFVASFAYLGRTQYNWDRKQLQKASPISHELNALFSSARMLLCEIETAINGSYPQSGQSKLTAISRAAMNRRLKFRTRAYEHQTSGGGGGGVLEVRDVDLKYAKHYYIDYVRQMLRVLRKNSKRTQKSHALASSSSSSTSAAAASFEDADLSMNSALVDESGSQSSGESVELLLAVESSTSRSSSSSSRKTAAGQRGGPKRRQHPRQRKNNAQE